MYKWQKFPRKSTVTSCNGAWSPVKSILRLSRKQRRWSKLAAFDDGPRARIELLPEKYEMRNRRAASSSRADISNSLSFNLSRASTDVIQASKHAFHSPSGISFTTDCGGTGARGSRVLSTIPEVSSKLACKCHKPINKEISAFLKGKGVLSKQFVIFVVFAVSIQHFCIKTAGLNMMTQQD